MIKCLSFFGVLFLLISCNVNVESNDQKRNPEKQNTFRLYSKSVGDSFSISVNLPNDYNLKQNEKYPVVYLLDANLYFDIIATTINKYSEVGLAPAVILVGIGYKDFQSMDSLRNRDYTYPVALAEYEMTVSGKADNFLSFIHTELFPRIEQEYKVDTVKRTLMGHSLGGYFTLYALMQHITGKSKSFSTYIAASPSLHYNNYYLFTRLKELPHQNKSDSKVKAYVTFGGLEEDESAGDSSMMKLVELSKQLSGLLAAKLSNKVIYKSDIFSNLGHMDTQIPTFIKGLRDD